MESRWASVIFSGGFAGVATSLGMYLVLVREQWSRLNSAPLVSYSAGVLLGVGILHIYPEAQELTAHAPALLLTSFLLFYFLEHHMFFHAGHEALHHPGLEPDCHDGHCHAPHPLGMVAFVGMTLHSLIDGIIIGTGFEAGEDIGLLSALAVVAHEVPEGIAMLSILLHYGYARQRAVLLTLLVAVATPAGAVATYALVQAIRTEILGGMMALAAGSFIYIAASDLIPESHRARGWKGSFALFCGVLTAVAAGLVAH